MAESSTIFEFLYNLIWNRTPVSQVISGRSISLAKRPVYTGPIGLEVEPSLTHRCNS